MKKALLFLLIVLTLAAPGCGGPGSAYTKYSYEFMGTFDTVIQVMGYTKSKAEFDRWAKMAEARFTELSRMYDMYKDYNGVNNIKTVNDNAGGPPVPVSPEIIGMLRFSMDWQAKSPGAVNIAFGATVKLWHDYREQGIGNPGEATLPPMEDLLETAKHADIGNVVLDAENGTVRLADPAMRLDVGSVAKGYATELVARELREKGWQSFILNSGGNARSEGRPMDGIRDRWGVGVTDPDGPGGITESAALLDTVYVSGQSVTTAGDYQRYYTVAGKRYHHIIDPVTLMPAEHFRAVTVVAEDSAVADFVDTVLFILPYEQGLAYVNGLENVEALWVLPDGTVKTTEGIRTKLKSQGGNSSK